MSNSSLTLSLLPPTSNPWILKFGDLALYNSTLLLAANALFQHAAVFGVLFLLRGFSSKRALDLHFLTIVFAATFIAAPLIFLVDTHIDSVKLWFFLEHEAIEYLIAIRVLAPIRFVQKHPGLIVLGCWTVLSIVSIIVSLNTQYKHGADIVAWGAFTSDSILSMAGCVLTARWYQDREYGRCSGEKRNLMDSMLKRKTAAEAMAGLGFMLHGLSTVTVAPVLTGILYDDLDPAYFAYAWVVVFFCAFFAVGLSVPSAALFFSTIHWCCWHDRKTLLGEAQWTYSDLEFGNRARMDRSMVAIPFNDQRVRLDRTGVIDSYWTRLAEKHAKSASPSIGEYGHKSGLSSPM